MQWSEFVQYLIDKVTSESIMARTEANGDIIPIREMLQV